MNSRASRVWPAALAAVSGSALVGVMPLIARHLYADGLSASSMLFWRYWLALVALAAAAQAMRLDLRQAARGGWRIVLVGATLGAAQTFCFWESLKTLETSIAVLLFYTYPAVTLTLDRLLFGKPIRLRAVLCIAVILLGAGLITGPGLRGGTIDPRGLAWAIPSPLFYAFYLAINSRLLRPYPPLIGAGGLFRRHGVELRPGCCHRRARHPVEFDRLAPRGVCRAGAGCADNDFVFLQRAAPRRGQFRDPCQCRACHGRDDRRFGAR